MAIDLSNVTKFPHYKTFSANHTTATEIILPRNCRKVEIGSESHKLYVAQNGGVDGQPLPNDKFFIPKDNAKSINIGQGAERIDSLFVQFSGGSGNVHIELSER